MSQKHKRKEARERSRPRRVDPHQAAGPSRKDLQSLPAPRTSWPDPDVMASGGDPDQDGHRTRLPGASALSFPTSRQLTSA